MMAKHTIRQELYSVLAFVALLWLVFIIGQVLPIAPQEYGIIPRTVCGLLGIPVAPLLHANLQHLISNTIPLTVLLLLLAGSRANTWMVVVGIVLLSGALLWLFGRPAIHIGASGLIYGLITYLIISGVRERNIGSMLTALVVGFLYGGALLSGVVPSSTPHISWEGHLFGAIAGGVVALVQTRNRASAELPTMIG
jgi:membrane associated rhomboid family serine protease